jgi:hypothetical protein
MANQTGIAIVIKAFLPTGKTLDEQFAALSIVKAAHETSDYAALLKAATIEEVKTEQKTRRVEDQPQTQTETKDETTTTTGGETTAQEQPETEAKPEPSTETADDSDVPAFLKNKKKAKAA